MSSVSIGTIVASALVISSAAFGGSLREPMQQTDPGASTAPQSADLAARAEQARADGRYGEAIALYRQAVKLRPGWAEGWWQLGTLLYDRDSYAEAAKAFRRATSLNPKVGTAWVMLGLCEFRTGNHEAALAHLQKGRQLGISPDPQLRRVMLYHEGMLLLGAREFERAQETLDQLAAEGVDSAFARATTDRDDEMKVALGLSVLRIRPSELRENDSTQRDLVRRAGRAENLAARKQFDEAQREYEKLATDFTETRNVHYALGRYFVATRQPDKAVTAFEREIEHFPDHVPARLGIAAIKAETDPAAALPYAEEAVRLNARIPLGHYVLGSLLLHTSQIERAIVELETAEQSVRDDPAIYYALARAYAKAGRSRDAERARATFKRLTEQRQAAALRVPADK